MPSIPQSIEYYEKSIASHAAAGDEADQTLMISKTWEMMAHAEVGRGNLDKAAQLYEKVLKVGHHDGLYSMVAL